MSASRRREAARDLDPRFHAFTISKRDGSKLPLPAPSSPPRRAWSASRGVLQGVPSNFDTDLVTPIIERAVEVVGAYHRGARWRVYPRCLADQARAVAFLLA